MKAIILARVSTEEQKEAGNSLPAQIERLKTYCKNRGFEIAKIFKQELTPSCDENLFDLKDKVTKEEFFSKTSEKINAVSSPNLFILKSKCFKVELFPTDS